MRGGRGPSPVNPPRVVDWDSLVEASARNDWFLQVQDQRVGLHRHQGALRLQDGQGNKSPQLFAEPESEYFFPEKATPANAKLAFDCTNKDMPLFPFTATAQVS